jgi:GxxExxY protein
MLLLEELSRDIIQDFYTVYNTLGYGFLESVYEKALKLELENSSRLLVERQWPINVYYKEQQVGFF